MILEYGARCVVVVGVGRIVVVAVTWAVVVVVIAPTMHPVVGVVSLLIYP